MKVTAMERYLPCTWKGSCTSLSFRNMGGGRGSKATRFAKLGLSLRRRVTQAWFKTGIILCYQHHVESFEQENHTNFTDIYCIYVNEKQVPRRLTHILEILFTFRKRSQCIAQTTQVFSLFSRWKCNFGALNLLENRSSANFLQTDGFGISHLHFLWNMMLFGNACALPIQVFWPAVAIKLDSVDCTILLEELRMPFRKATERVPRAQMHVVTSYSTVNPHNYFLSPVTHYSARSSITQSTECRFVDAQHYNTGRE